MSLQALTVCSTMAPSTCWNHCDTTSPYSCVPALKSRWFQHRSAVVRAFCVSGFALDDLGQADTPHKAPSGLTGLGVTESPGGCALMWRKRIPNHGDIQRPWAVLSGSRLREADAKHIHTG